MNKTELIAAVAQNSGVSKKDAERVVNAAIDTITATLAAGEKVQLSGFGMNMTDEAKLCSPVGSTFAVLVVQHAV